MNTRPLIWMLAGAAGVFALQRLAARRQASVKAGATPSGVPVTDAPGSRAPVPHTGIRETLAFVGEVILPTLAKGVILRRPAMVALAERMDLDRRAVRRVQRLQERYGRGPVLLRIPIRRQAVILDPEHVHRVLRETPEPFSADTWEKHGALSHFQPQGVLISYGADRAARRRFNEEVLDTARRVHRLAESFLPRVEEEAGVLIGAAQGSGTLTWSLFGDAWLRLVRRVVFGDAARVDEALTDTLASLRARANWSVLAPKDRPLRKRFLAQVGAWLERGEPGSLSELIRQMPGNEHAAPESQVGHWLFAFDAAAIAAYRALALLSTHATPLDRARAEIRGAAGSADLPFLRACVLESVRLWPTTPMVLRETTRETEWETGLLPAHTHLILFAPYFHRNQGRLPYADRFAPDVWGEDLPRERESPLIPFSEGPASCPAKHLVLLLTSALLRALLDGRSFQLLPAHRLSPASPLPGTLDHFTLRFTVEPREIGEALRQRPSS